MKRWLAGTLIGVAVAAVVVGLPQLWFLMNYRHRAWDAATWFLILAPNVVLFLLVGVAAAGLYFLATRRR